MSLRTQAVGSWPSCLQAGLNDSCFSQVAVGVVPGLLGGCPWPGQAAGIYLGSQPPSQSCGAWELRALGWLEWAEGPSLGNMLLTQDWAESCLVSQGPSVRRLGRHPLAT